MEPLTTTPEPYLEGTEVAPKNVMIVVAVLIGITVVLFVIGLGVYMTKTHNSRKRKVEHLDSTARDPDPDVVMSQTPSSALTQQPPCTVQSSDIEVSRMNFPTVSDKDFPDALLGFTSDKSDHTASNSSLTGRMLFRAGADEEGTYTR